MRKKGVNWQYLSESNVSNSGKETAEIQIYEVQKQHQSDVPF